MTAKILLFILGIGTSNYEIAPIAEQYDSAKSCAEAAKKVDFSNYTRVVVACIDSSTGQIAYLVMKR